MKQRILMLFSLILLTLSLSCGILVNNEKFDSAKWKNGKKRTKGKMVYDLQNSKILVGKNKSEASELLGKDNYPSPNRLTYEIDTNILTDIYFSVHFDEKTEQVVSTDIGD